MSDDRHHEQHHEQHHDPLEHILKELRNIVHLLHSIHTQGAHVIMSLNAQAQAIADANNASTNKVAAAVTSVATAITTGVKAIVDLVAGSSDAELAAALQPNFDKLNTAAETLEAGAAALIKVATDADPAITPGAPPIVIPPPVQ